MNRSRLATTVAVTALAGLAGVTGAGIARAAGDPFVAMQVFDLLCEEDGGMPVNSPYAIGRCQDARGNADLTIERLVCEGLLDGGFHAVESFARPSRTTWACVAGSPAG